MSKTSTIRARIQPELMDKAEHVFSSLDLTTTQAITLFYNQVELRGGLPFEVTIPNETTRRTFAKTDAGHDLIVCEDTDDMFRKLGICCSHLYLPASLIKTSIGCKSEERILKRSR